MEVQNANQNLVEPLSQRELEVLRLIAAGLSSSEIGAVLTKFGYNNAVPTTMDEAEGRIEVVDRTDAPPPPAVEVDLDAADVELPPKSQLPQLPFGLSPPPIDSRSWRFIAGSGVTITQSMSSGNGVLSWIALPAPQWYLM